LTETKRTAKAKANAKVKAKVITAANVKGKLWKTRMKGGAKTMMKVVAKVRTMVKAV
jgi:hypothetical protein